MPGRSGRGRRHRCGVLALFPAEPGDTFPLADANEEIAITVEPARPRLVPKPWGSNDLRPWSAARGGDDPIGEIWFQRDGPSDTALLMKLLFPKQPLSIQVHPDDRYARSLGLPHGKTEAWYILSAEPGAKVALGLKHVLTRPELRVAILNGSIEDLVQWRPVVADEVIVIPAGTIHAIGAGLVVAEIQQTSDTTFRLFDFSRGRALHVDDAVAVADAKPAPDQPFQRRLTDTRLLLATSPYFVLERIDLAAAATWQLKAGQETWLLVLDGQLRAGGTEMHVGDALFVDGDHVELTSGANGLKALVAYVGTEPVPDLLQGSDERLPGSFPFEPTSHATETAA